MFRIDDAPPINKHQPVSGESLHALFAELANARAEMAEGSEEIPFHDYVSQRAARLVDQRGGTDRAKLRMRELGEIAAGYAGIPHLGTPVETLEGNPDKVPAPVGDEFFTNMTIARGMMRLDGIMCGLMLIDQGKTDAYKGMLTQKLNTFVASPRSEEQGAFNFVSAVHAFQKRTFPTKLDALKIMQIDYLRAIYFLSVRLSHPRMGVPQARALYWQQMNDAAATQGIDFQAIQSYAPTHFKEVDFGQALRARAVAPV